MLRWFGGVRRLAVGVRGRPLSAAAPEALPVKRQWRCPVCSKPSWLESSLCRGCGTARPAELPIVHTWVCRCATRGVLVVEDGHAQCAACGTCAAPNNSPTPAPPPPVRASLAPDMHAVHDAGALLALGLANAATFLTQPPSLGGLFHRLATVGVGPQHAADLQRLCIATTPVLMRCNVRTLCVIVSSLRKMGVTPPSAFGARWTAAALVRLPKFQPVQLSIALTSLAALPAWDLGTLGAAFFEAWLRAAAPVLPLMGAKDVGYVLHALHLRLVPPLWPLLEQTGFAARCCEAAMWKELLLPACAAVDVAHLMNSMLHLGLAESAPGRDEWVPSWTAACLKLVPRLSAVDLNRLCEALCFAPPEWGPWLAPLWPPLMVRAQQLLAEGPADGAVVANTVMCLQQFDVELTEPFAQRVVAAVRTLPPAALSAYDVALLLYVAAVWDASLGALAPRLFANAAARFDEFRPDMLALVLWSLSRAHGYGRLVLTDGDVLERWANVALAKMEQFQPRDLATIVLTVSKLDVAGRLPEAQWRNGRGPLNLTCACRAFSVRGCSTLSPCCPRATSRSW